MTHFQTIDIAFIITGLLLVAVSCLLLVRGKVKPALWVLLAGGFILRLWMAFIDPYINLWDEQFHAMVAKNMMEHPFHPMLYADPVLQLSDRVWTGSSTWLHKPPLFLWQIALFMKIFGAKYWVVRLPSVLLTTLAIPVVFRMGKILSGEKTGFFAALIFTVVNLQVNIVSGFLNTDHNDVIFMCYVLFSLWAWMEHMQKPGWKWIIAIGIFSGMAILVKWLPGLLVYLAWISAMLADRRQRFIFKKWVEPFMSLVITFIIAAPWFIYETRMWPELSAYEAASRIKHLSAVVEQHDGPWYFHFQLLVEDYGWWMAILLPACVILFVFQKDKRAIRVGMCIAVIFVYAFYTWVPTRMPLFCLFVSPLLYVVLADVIANAKIYFNKWKEIKINTTIRVGQFLVLFAAVYFIFNVNRIEHFHTDLNIGNVYRPARIENKKQFELAVTSLPSKEIVIFNCGGQANGVACMFYTGIISYTGIPNEEQFYKLKLQGIIMAVFDDVALPDYLMNDESVIKLHFQLVRNGF